MLKNQIVGKDPFLQILGQDFTKKQLKSILLLGRHVLVLGPPGIGKTTLAKNVASLLPEIDVNDCDYHCSIDNPLCPSCISKKTEGRIKIKGSERFVRIQGSPDLTVEDLIGDIDPVKALEFGPTSIEAFTPGKIFKANNGVLFFDEVNRCPEKLQNALLQVLEERVATIGSYSIDLPANFIFIGTMNPDDSSTEPLSHVFKDRFDVIEMGYPESTERETTIVKDKGIKLDVEFPEYLLKFAVDFVRVLRASPDLEQKPSVRATLGLYERAQANAVIEQRKVVKAQDIHDAVVSVLAHRIELKPSVKYVKKPEQIIEEAFSNFSRDHLEEYEEGDVP